MLPFANEANFSQLFMSCSSSRIPEVIRIDRIKQAYDALLGAYTEPHRVYHDIRHINDLLAVFELPQVAHLAADPERVKAGIWIHDAVYRIGSATKEIDSGKWCIPFLLDLECNLRFCFKVIADVYATNHLSPPRDSDAQMLVDIDLSGFAKPWDEFLRNNGKLYAENVLRGGVPEEVYWKNRDEFLRRLLEKPIYVHPLLRRMWEDKARINIERVLKQEIRPTAF